MADFLAQRHQFITAAHAIRARWSRARSCFTFRGPHARVPIHTLCVFNSLAQGYLGHGSEVQPTRA